MSRKVLIVDDSAAMVLGLALHLRAAGYGADSATDGDAGLKAVTENRPDVILLDVNMPNMDGFEFIRRLGSLRDCAHIPVILLSGDTDGVLRNEARIVGVKHVLSKIHDISQLVAAIEDVTRSQPENAGAPNDTSLDG